jgi:hypothetical protein
MSKILDCEATNCAYNRDRKCHTPGITIGDTEPICDTFYPKDMKGGQKDIIGGVGACKVESCQYNNSLECSADGIQIKMQSSHPDCATYSAV